MISTKQHRQDEWFILSPQNVEEFWKLIDIWGPLVVNSQAEKDYILGMGLVLGKSISVLLDGIDEAIPNCPPTYVKVDL